MIDPYRKKTYDRLKRAKGQIEGILRMMDQDQYCIDVLTQVLALQGSLKAISLLVLESHMKSCGVKDLSSDDSKTREKFIQEILKIVKFTGR